MAIEAPSLSLYKVSESPSPSKWRIGDVTVDGPKPPTFRRRASVHPKHTAFVVRRIVVFKPPFGALVWRCPLRDIGVIGSGLIILLPNDPLGDMRGCGWCGLILLKLVMTLVVGGRVLIIVLIIHMLMAMPLSILTGMLPSVGIHMLIAMFLSMLTCILHIVHHFPGLPVVRGLRGTVDNVFFRVHCGIEDN